MYQITVLKPSAMDFVFFLNPLHAIFQKKNEHVFMIYIIPPHWLMLKSFFIYRKDLPIYIINIIAADDLVT